MMISTLVTLLVFLVVFGVVFYLARLLLDMIPMDARVKQIAYVVLVLIFVVVLFERFMPMLGSRGL